jgi:AcrR family transcriptional regulator
MSICAEQGSDLEALEATPRRLTREQTRQQTRERLLAAAAEVFLRKGFTAATVDEIAEAAGFSKGAVYANFSGKDDLFLAVLDRHTMREAPVWAPVLAPDVPPAERRAGILRLLEQATADLRERARSGRSTWTLLELEFVLSAYRSPKTRAKLADYYRDFRSGSERVTGDPDRTWLLHALGLGISILVGVDPDAAPGGLWDLAAPALFAETPLPTGTAALQEEKAQERQLGQGRPDGEGA